MKIALACDCYDVLYLCLFELCDVDGNRLDPVIRRFESDGTHPQKIT